MSRKKVGVLLMRLKGTCPRNLLRKRRFLWQEKVVIQAKPLSKLFWGRCLRLGI